VREVFPAPIFPAMAMCIWLVFKALFLCEKGPQDKRLSLDVKAWEGA
jgi:hypothetical protein